MARPKIIKLFLASSSELAEDRKEFEIFINRKNKTLIKDNSFIEGKTAVAQSYINTSK